MDKSLFNMLNYISEGIIITNDNLEIVFWNTFIENLMGKKMKGATRSQLFEIIPGLNLNYFKQAMKETLEIGHKFFYSAAMHEGVISETIKLNITFSRLVKNDNTFLMIEFADVTNQILRINELKKTNKKLQLLNDKLKEKEIKIKKLAYYDGLTGLANRRLFYDISDKILEDSKRNNKKMCLMFIDVDNFKNINDMYGHKTGDKVLKEIANMLTSSTRKLDIVSRYGGDEFLILLPDLKHFDNYKTVTNRINEASKCIYLKKETSIEICLSIGVSFYPKHGNNIETLICEADKAMYSAKNRGGDNCLELS